MGGHLHDDPSTAGPLGQDIAPASEIVAERRIVEQDSHATAESDHDESTSTLFDRQQLKSLFRKPSHERYEPVLTMAHNLPYKTILRNCARSYAEQGLHIFPCRPMDVLDEDGEIKHKAKTPLTRNGHKDATIDPARVAYWWSEFPNSGYPDALIGIRTGLISGIFVVDVDVKNGVDGMAELKKLEAKYGALPDTHVVRTPSGGMHYYFKMPDVDLRCSTGKIAPGVDVRANDGYVIAPPSMMADGTKYEAMTDSTPNKAAWAPPWLIDLVKAAPSTNAAKTFDKIASQGWAYRMLARRCEDVIGAAEGTRNETLNKAAFVIGRLVGDGALDRSAAFDTLMEAARKAALEEQESRKTINSGLTSGAKEKGSQPQYPDWTKAGPKPGSIDNVRAMLSWMGVKLRYNLFIERAEMFGFQDYTLLNDNAWAELWSAAFEYGFQPSKQFLANALEAIALQDKYHPVKEYFESLEWDGVKRLDKLFIDYAGAEDNEYVRAVGAKTLIAATRRIYEPGTKFDTMPVLESIKQGAGKSTMLSILAVRKEWFTDGVSLTDKTKEVIEQVEGCLIVEIQELKGMKHGDVESTKAFLSRTRDKARKAYGRFASDLPRQFVLFATTNPGEKASYLKDKTGNRRFWPVRTSDEIDLASLKRDRDQLWAEAVHRHKAGESLLLPKHLWDFAAAEQEKRVAQHPWVAILEDAFQDGDKPMLGKVRVEDVWALLGKKEAPKANHEMTDLGEAMRKLGWEHSRLRLGSDGKRCYVYVRGAPPYREITVTARFGDKPIIRYAKEPAEEEY